MKIRTAGDLGATLRARRRELRLDQQTLAERVGVSRQWVIAIERGKPRAELGLVLRALEALGLELDVGPRGQTTEPRAVGAARTARAAYVPDIDAIVRDARKPR